MPKTFTASCVKGTKHEIRTEASNEPMHMRPGVAGSTLKMNYILAATGETLTYIPPNTYQLPSTGLVLMKD